jgi:hypothetical protein
MLFSVIFEVETTSDERIGHYKPPHTRKLWQLTEGDDQRDYGYLCECPKKETCTCGYRHTKHRKWCALLTAKQFREFVDATGLFAETTKTMGSLGAPGFGFGWAPAISFRGDEGGNVICHSAYVTPILDKLAERRLSKLPEAERENAAPLTEEDWDRVEAAVLRAYAA